MIYLLFNKCAKRFELAGFADTDAIFGMLVAKIMDANMKNQGSANFNSFKQEV